MNQYLKDSLAICHAIGHPSLFLTMTCNTQWPETNNMLEHLYGVAVDDAPDIVDRVFKLMLDQLLHLINKQNYFGKCIEDISSVYSAYLDLQVLFFIFLILSSLSSQLCM